MADLIFNIAKGRIIELHDRVDGNDPSTAGIGVLLLKSGGESDSLMKDRDTIAAVLSGSTECDFTGYARKTLTDADVSASVVDDTNDRREADLPDQTWSPAGGGTNNTVAKAVVFYIPSVGVSADSACVPLGAYDVLVSGSPPTTNGGDLTLITNAAGHLRAA